jgi:hypothetical protein
MAGLASPFAHALGEPRATHVLRILSINLVLAGISATPAATLQREFRTDRLFVAEMSNFVLSTACAVGLAAAGAGATSLAWSSPRRPSGTAPGGTGRSPVASWGSGCPSPGPASWCSAC